MSLVIHVAQKLKSLQTNLQRFTIFFIAAHCGAISFLNVVNNCAPKMLIMIPKKALHTKGDYLRPQK